MASTTPTPMRTKEAVKPDLWKQALATLNAEDQKQYEDCSSSMLDMLKQVCNYRLIMRMCIVSSGTESVNIWFIYKVQETTESKKQDCVSKGWKVYRNKQGEEVKLRHVLEKVSVWVKGIINIVDVGVSFDQSGHAALPWGIVKYLTTVRDHAVRVPKPTNTREYRLASQILMCSAVLLKALNLVLALWRDMSSSKNYIYTMSVKQYPDCRKLLETSTQTFSLTWQESRLTSQAVLGVSARLRLTNGVRICYT